MLWPQHVVKKLIGVVDGQPLRYVLSRGNAQTNFKRFKIAPGDTLVPIHIDAGRICPIARMSVVYKGTAAAWNLSLVAGGGERLPVDSEHVQVLVGVRGTPQHFHRPLPADLVRELRYDGAKGPRALVVDDDGKLAQHAGVDGVFRLMPESADELISLSWI
jgi:hypothetical protein